MRFRHLMLHVAAALRAPRPCLVHRDTFGALQVFRLDHPAVIGSGLEASVRIPDPTVSRSHCALYPVNGPDGGLFWFICDLGSLNGTWLNGRRVGRHDLPTPIRSGDCIRLGRTQVAMILLEEAGNAEVSLSSSATMTPPRRDSEIGLAPATA